MNAIWADAALRALSLPALLPGEDPAPTLKYPHVHGPDGAPVSFREWMRLRALPECHLITDVAPGITVSTVCIGFDHGFGGVPLFWETMTFGGEFLSDDYQWRYGSRGAARAGHDAVVAILGGGHEVEAPPVG